MINYAAAAEAAVLISLPFLRWWNRSWRYWIFRPWDLFVPVCKEMIWKISLQGVATACLLTAVSLIFLMWYVPLNSCFERNFNFNFKFLFWRPFLLGSTHCCSTGKEMGKLPQQSMKQQQQELQQHQRRMMLSLEHTVLLQGLCLMMWTPEA